MIMHPVAVLAQAGSSLNVFATLTCSYIICPMAVLDRAQFDNFAVEFFDAQELHKFLNATQNPCAAAPCSAQLLLVDGFTIDQWSGYARLKASIASRVCCENGNLKAQLHAFSSVGDPWANRSLSTVVHAEPAHDPWQHW